MNRMVIALLVCFVLISILLACTTVSPDPIPQPTAVAIVTLSVQMASATAVPQVTLFPATTTSTALEAVWQDVKHPEGQLQFYPDGRAEMRYGKGVVATYQWRWVDARHLSFVLGGAVEVREVTLAGDSLTMKTSTGQLLIYSRVRP